MERLLRLYRDPQESESIGGAMLDAMNEAESPKEEVSESVEEKPSTKFAWGDEERRKARAELKDDDEIDLGYEEEKDGNKAPAKRKLSEIKQTAKWLKENQGLVQSAVGIREQLTKNPDLAKAFNAFWAKSFDGDKYNPEAVAKMSAFLDGKEDSTKTKIEDATEDIKEMEALLEELDQESPQAKIMRTNINGLKSTRAQLKEALNTIKSLQERTEGHDKFKMGLEDKEKKQNEEKAAGEAAKVFDEEMEVLTSKENGYKFDDSDDSKEFNESVRDLVASQAAAGKINNDAEFKKAIQDAAKASFERISKRNERVVNKYLKSKGKLPPEKEEKKEEKTEDHQSIGEMLAGTMFPDKK